MCLDNDTAHPGGVFNGVIWQEAKNCKISSSHASNGVKGGRELNAG